MSRRCCWHYNIKYSPRKFPPSDHPLSQSSHRVFLSWGFPQIPVSSCCPGISLLLALFFVLFSTEGLVTVADLPLVMLSVIGLSLGLVVCSNDILLVFELDPWLLGEILRLVGVILTTDALNIE